MISVGYVHLSVDLVSLLCTAKRIRLIKNVGQEFLIRYKIYSRLRSSNELFIYTDERSLLL